MTYLSLNHLLQGAEVDPKKIALIIGETTFTYADLDSLSDKLAVALIKRGINVGDRVAFLLPNCLEIVLCYYACLKIGAIAVPLNIRFKSEMLQYVINDSEADILICDGDLFVEIAKIRNQLKTVKHIYLTQGKNNFSGVYDFNDLLTTKKSTVLPILSAETPAVIFYTSGTTGYPKGVIHTHYSLQQAMISQTKQININQNDITLVMFPLCYLIGFGSQLLTYHACGATCVLLPYFEPKSALESMHRYKITKIYGFPGLYNELINYPKAAGYQLKTLNFCLSGGEAIPVALQKRFKKLFGVEITEGCGMTELQFYAMNHPYQAKKVGSIGKPIVDVKINLIDVHGEKISQPKKVGEIIVHSAAMTAGYWRNPGLTQQMIQNGWFHTGDLAYYDEDGFYWFVSRKSEIITHQNQLVSPIEVESALYQHPCVKEAGVVGISDATESEKIRAYVVLKENSQTTEQELISFIKPLLASYKLPQQIIFIDRMPYGPTGKIDRKSLKKLNNFRKRA